MPPIRRRPGLAATYNRLKSRSGLSCLVLFALVLVLWQASKLVEHLSSGRDQAQHLYNNDAHIKSTIWWHAPFYSGTGYSSEAIAFMLALWNSSLVPRQQLSIAQHGDGFEQPAYNALADEVKKALHLMERSSLWGLRGRPIVVVCHSAPGAWSVPEFEWGSPHECPPEGLRKGQAYAVGRTMFETDRLSKEVARRCNKMDEIWVPTEFHREAFAKSGVRTDKLHVVAEPVDVHFFNPEGVTPRALPLGQLVFGRPKSALRHVAFLSIFKWEQRKGWDILLEAFLTEFTSKANVALYMKTTAYHSDSEFAQHMQQWVAEHVPGTTPNKLPSVYVIDEQMSQERLRSLYAAVDCFVLPSRGEGWGRPHVEAMSMGLPVIATNWSGPTAFLDESVGYPLPIEGLEPVADELVNGPLRAAFEGHLWAKPSVQHLRLLMRRVVQDRTEAQTKGRAARELMMTKFAPEVVAQEVVQQLQRIEAHMS